MLNRSLTCLLMVVALTLGAFAQKLPDLPPLNGGPLPRLEAAAVPMSTTFVGDALFTMHADGGMSLAAIDADGELCASFYASGGGDTPQGVGDPVPTLRTSWCDKDGVTHEVVTPIVSTTEAGLTRATQLHDRLVGLLQARHPPKPCPAPTPPPPPPGP